MLEALATMPRWAVYLAAAVFAAVLVFVLLLVFIVLLLTVTIPAIDDDGCTDGFCPSRSAFSSSSRDHQTIFAALSAEEHRDLMSWLLSSAPAATALNLTSIDEASLRDNYVFLADALPPNKAEALAYLDASGPKPKRYAHVVIYFGHTQLVQEFKVGPLPTSAATTAERWDTVTYKGGADIPFNSRIPDTIEYDAIDAQIMVPLAADLASIFQESYSATYEDCTDVCLTYTDSAPRSSEVNPNSRQTWFFWVYSVDGLWVQNVGFETLVEHNSTDPNDFKLLMIVYNGQAFETVTEFKDAYAAGSINKTVIRPDKTWTGFSRQGEPFPGDDMVGSRYTEPRGKRFNISGNHIEYMGWKFDWSITPLSGVSLWDIRFRNDRIVYEMGSQEVFVPYSGRNPSQVNSVYLDTAWGFGASAFPLKAGIDCPETAAFLDVVQLFQTSEPQVHKNAICVFEKDGAIPLRRHFDVGDPYNFYAGTATHALVFRHAVTDYNYDYVLDYTFYPTGAIKVEIAATGYLQGTFWLAEDEQYGSHRTGPYSAGTLHQHIFSYKVDIDALGTANTLRVTSFPVQTYNAPWFVKPKSRPVPQHTYVLSEDDSTFFPNYSNPLMFVFTNNGSKNQWGMERGYKIHSTSFAKNLYDQSPEFPEAISWTKYSMAVVKRQEDEPTVNNVYVQARAYDPFISKMRSLDSWLNGESLEQEDLVAWLSIGLTHYPHAEDVPLLGGPYNYFGRDPASALRDTVVLRPDPKTGAAIPDKDPMALKPAADCTYHTADVPYRGPATAA